MRFYNSNFKSGVSAAALFALAVSANAQTTILDTIGTGSKWGIGQTRTNAVAVGYDASPAVPAVPTTAATAGYAVLPFTISDTASVQSLSQVDIVMNLQTPATGISNLPSLSGAIVAANASGSLSLTGLSASDFFSFDTTPNSNPINPAFGDGFTHIYSATGLGAVNLIENQTYWLIIAPKKGLGAQSGDALLDYGLLNDRVLGDVTGSGGSLTNPIATVGQGLYERQGANAGDTLLGATVGRGTGSPAYFGARIIGTAVPEPSSLFALAGGIALAGGTLLRRRK